MNNSKLNNLSQADAIKEGRRKVSNNVQKLKETKTKRIDANQSTMNMVESGNSKDEQIRNNLIDIGVIKKPIITEEDKIEEEIKDYFQKENIVSRTVVEAINIELKDKCNKQDMDSRVMDDRGEIGIGQVGVETTLDEISKVSMAEEGGAEKYKVQVAPRDKIETNYPRQTNTYVQPTNEIVTSQENLLEDNMEAKSVEKRRDILCEGGEFKNEQDRKHQTQEIENNDIGMELDKELEDFLDEELDIITDEIGNGKSNETKETHGATQPSKTGINNDGNITNNKDNGEDNQTDNKMGDKYAYELQEELEGLDFGDFLATDDEVGYGEETPDNISDEVNPPVDESTLEEDMDDDLMDDDFMDDILSEMIQDRERQVDEGQGQVDESLYGDMEEEGEEEEEVEEDDNLSSVLDDIEREFEREMSGEQEDTKGQNVVQIEVAQIITNEEPNTAPVMKVNKADMSPLELMEQLNKEAEEDLPPTLDADTYGQIIDNIVENLRALPRGENLQQALNHEIGKVNEEHPENIDVIVGLLEKNPDLQNMMRDADFM